MNRNNQNEYEIIDAPHCGCPSDDDVRYPLASDPNAALQNMNYKDYLQMTDEDYTDSYINPSLSISGRDAVQTALTVVGRILGALGVPFSGQIVSFYQFLLNTLWPVNDTAIWEAFMRQVEELVNQQITEFARNQALARLQGLGDSFNVYQRSLQNWLADRNDTRNLSVVRAQFIALDLDFVNAIPLFAVNGQQVPLLSVYAQAVNLHLLLLKDASLFGEGWGFTQGEISTYYDRQLELTAKYTNYCETWYNTGLDRLRGTNTESWLRYHQFRREMTLVVLDVVALFPYYDVRLYPTGSNPQLTREVYTDPIVFNPPANVGLCRRWGTNPYNTFSELENAFIRPPHLFDRLNSLTISSNRFPVSSNFMDYWSGHTLRRSYLNDSAVQEDSYGLITTTRATINPGVDGTNRIESTAVDFRSALIGIYGVNRASFVPGGLFNGTTSPANGGCRDLYDTNDELPPDESTGSSTHRLSHVTFFSFQTNQAGSIANAGSVPTYVWTRRDVDLNNTITPNRITQLPLVKASAPVSGTTVLKGPGFTGGGILRRTTNGTFGTLRVTVNSPLTQRYRVRVRFASSGNFSIRILRGNTSIAYQRFGSTMNRGQELTYESFVTSEFTTNQSDLPFTFTQAQENLTILAEGVSTGSEYFIDRIEIIPVNPAREAEEDLEAAKKAVANLFTRTRDGLQVNVTDYQVDQAANLVSCLSDEQYGHDKKMLLEAVRAAKRLSRERNLLQDPDFNTINSTEENGWKASNGVTISEGGPFFKGRALQLASARENYPTYIYQKVDASVLKPYTRYRLDGFVKSSQDLEIDLIHHHKVHLVKNVPDNLVSDTYSDGSCSGINRCDEQHQVDMQLDAEHHPMDCCEAAQTHEFSSYINTGDLNASVDQGIWVVLKVRTTDGYATLGNLELVEVGPLSGESLEREQRDNAKWNAELGRKRAEIDRVYLAAKQAINHLFVDYQDQQLNPEIGLAEINEASNLVESISGVYSDTLLQIPGINYEIYTELSDRLQQASYLYTSRNAVQNGDFNSGLDSWNTTMDASVQQDGNMHFLVLSHWDAQVSQQLRVNPNCKYVLRVTARKVGGGDGYVTIRDGAHHQETLTFNACDYDVNGTYVNDNSYITEEVVFYPETKHMWVEVSESEGSFYIDSIEFIETQE
ncbi:insecticidal delta-endotoxin Cry8Ea1 family protein [Bacillus cereus]|uniref:insecticidal delta-endotoxin Cry8Ea1 family protein n=1 Tax=Bacillus cereus TaxID=1396 RepID=UPI0000038C1F|nr:insecticidal delta-endotoxin Cry8Ea1 family protein [Bacillus cereus]MEC3021792.1 insecticidal delta-endotoxin Cry8Ea1 family protein [Bacillus cereus]MEC3262728.1 insecticidal delta-endotoxin Cry8Ea1 family protein [Bacillus cereus]PGQ65575.1 pesticidal protein [Bacillus cereus]